MKLKTYQAWTMGEALAFVKTDLGADAVILHTRTFERGGFFGIGKRSVVEITAARAQDMPRIEVRGRGAGAGGQAAATAGAAGAGNASSAGRSGDALRMSAATRAYGAQTRSGDDAAAVGARSSEAGRPFDAGRSLDAGRPLDMESEREKTRRLAQAMAISLERQAGERGSATRNEDAVRDAAMSAARSAPAAPARSETTPIDGPAQRFVIVPEAGGASRLTAAVVRVPDGAGVNAPNSGPGQPGNAAPAASISPTHSSVDVVRAIVESKPNAGEGELDAISDFVGRVLKRGGSDAGAAAAIGAATTPAAAAATATTTSSTLSLPATPAPARPGPLGAVHAHLLEQEVGAELADRIMNHIARQFGAVPQPSEPPTEADVRRAVEQRLVALLPDDAGDAFDVQLGRHGPRRIAFVGPTGVGKTTTLAKIAAQLKLKRGLRVGIVAADTYRIAAVDQLRTYAEILGLPVEIASSPKDAARACASLSDVDVILIDTAGRSQNDHMKISELRAFLGSAQPDETHLVLSATAGFRTLSREAEAFGPLGVDRLVLTKLDEAAAFGALVTLVERLGKRVSFFTQGQEVPDHIELGRNRRLAALVMGSEVR